jgi:hypothetical protein
MIVNGAQNFNSHQRQVIYLSLVNENTSKFAGVFIAINAK